MQKFIESTRGIWLIFAVVFVWGAIFSLSIPLAHAAATPTAQLSASQTWLPIGQNSTLIWSSTNATSCTASGGWTGNKATTGTQTVTPAASTTYSLVCNGAGGTSNSVSVKIEVIIGRIYIFRFDQSGANFMARTQAKIDANAQTLSIAHPASFTDITMGSHTAYATDLPGYDEYATKCVDSLPVAGYTPSLCTPASDSYSKTNVTCAGGFCSVPVTANRGQNSKVFFKYVPTNVATTPLTGTVRIKRVDSTLNIISGTEAKVDSILPMRSTNPAEYISVSTGSQIAYATDLLGYDEYAAQCSYATGAAECTPNATAYSKLSCSTYTQLCSVPVTVTSNKVSMVVFKYVATATKPLILIKPNGGEKFTIPSSGLWLQGDKDILFALGNGPLALAGADVANRFTVALIRKDGTVMNSFSYPIITCGNATPAAFEVAGGFMGCSSIVNRNSNLTLWYGLQLPPTFPPGDYKLKWSVYGLTSDTSDDYFTIVNPNVTVTSPTTYALTVTKSGTGTGTVTGGTINCEPTCSATVNTGTSVTLTANPTSGSTFTGWSGACTNTTGTCTVTKAGTATATFNTTTPTSIITVLNPNGGEKFIVGQTLTVKWSSQNIPANEYMHINLQDANGQSYLSKGAINDGLDDIVIPTAPPQQYKIYISKNQDPSIIDSSNSYFTIASSKTPTSITVLSPGQDESLKVSTPYTIKWTRTRATNERFDIVKIENGVSIKIVSGLKSKDAGCKSRDAICSYLWMPSALSSSARIAVSKHDTDDAAYSGYFKITSASGGTTTPTTGSILIRQFNNENDEVLGAQAKIDGTLLANNPRIISGLSTGAHTAYTANLLGYDKYAGTCSYPAGGVECMTYTSVSVNCTEAFCSTPVNIVANTVTKVLFRYVPVAVISPTVTVLPWSGSANVTTIAGAKNLNYTLNWNSTGKMDKSWAVFVHFVKEDNSYTFGDDFWPTPATNTPGWSGFISTNKSFAIPSNTPLGKYKVMVGLYGNSGRVNTLIAGSNSVGSVSADTQYRYQVGTLTVTPSLITVLPM